MDCPKCGSVLEKAEQDDYWMCEKCSAYFTEFHLEIISELIKARDLASEELIKQKDKVLNHLWTMCERCKFFELGDLFEPCCNCKDEDLIPTKWERKKG